jgi:hypothetical protein
VGSLHWLIVIPLYFFAALSLLLLSIVGARLLRLRVSINPIVTAAVSAALLLVVAPVVIGWVTLEIYTGRLLVALLLASFAIAALDTLLQSLLPLRLDKELEEL